MSKKVSRFFAATLSWNLGLGLFGTAVATPPSPSESAVSPTAQSLSSDDLLRLLEQEGRLERRETVRGHVCDGGN